MEPKRDLPPAFGTLDHIWLKYKDDIRGLAVELENQPKTYPGEQIVKDLLLPRLREQQSIIGMVYARLANIVHTLVYLSEAKTGADLAEDDFFLNQDNQLILLKAFGLYIEKVFQQPSDETEKPNYYGYRPIFEGLLKELGSLEETIKKQQKPLPNIVGSLIMIVKHSLEANGVPVGKLDPDYINQELNWEHDTQTKENLMAVFDSFQSKVAGRSDKVTKPDQP